MPVTFAARGPVALPSAIVSTTTWNPSDKTAGMTLSGGNLTTSSSASSGNTVRAIASASTGKYYWEITTGTIPSEPLYGILNTAISVVGDYVVGFSSATAGLYFNGQIRVNGANVGTMDGVTDVGWVVSIALDLNNLKIWFRVNGGDWNGAVIGSQNPATNTGGADISAVALPVHAALTYMQGQTDTTNFGGSAYAYTPPSGFGNW